MSILRRKWFFDNMELMLQELAYHKKHDDSEDLEGKVIWSDTETETWGPAATGEE